MGRRAGGEGCQRGADRQQGGQLLLGDNQGMGDNQVSLGDK